MMMMMIKEHCMHMQIRDMLIGDTL